MKKVVINVCFGGFGLSQEAYKRLAELGVPVKKYVEQKPNPKTGLYDNRVEKVIYRGGLGWGGANRLWDSWIDEDRGNPLLIQVVEELKSKANGVHAELRIVKIPDDVEYEIDDYDGNEHIAEIHRTWR